MQTLAGVLLVAVGFAASLVSDLLIRARGLSGESGIDASAYDRLGLAALVLGGTVILTSLFATTDTDTDTGKT